MATFGCDLNAAQHIEIMASLLGLYPNLMLGYLLADD